MKEMKKILAFFLCFVMVLGFVPVQAFAADTEAVLDAAIFCSDVHGSTSDLTSVLGGVAKSGVTYSSIGFVGDTCLTVAKTESTVTSSLNYAPKVMFSYAASHDTEEGADIGDKWDYSGEVEGVSEHYLVYTIRETDMRYYADATTAAAEFVEWAKTADTSKPLFIMTHRPLHARRNDNAGASTWFNAIYEVAKSMDVVVLWAHNHTSESSVDIEHYYIAKGGQLYLNTSTTGTSVEMTDEEEIALSASAETYAAPGSNSGSATGEYVETNFTYMNAGYINANNQSPARIGVATTVQIYEDKMVFQDYNKSGAYTGTYAHNETVFFEHADLSEEEVVVVTPAQLVVTGTNEYTVGDTYEAPTVSVTYSDGSTKEVTDYEMTSEPELDMNTAGTYLLTFTYSETVNGQTYKAEAQFTVTVKEAETEPTTESTTEATEAPKTVSYMTISEGNGVPYVVGDQRILYKMYVYYKDGTDGYVDQDDCTLTIYDEQGNVVTEGVALSTPGTYSADVTYLGFTCGTRLTFTVSASGDSAYELLKLVINGAEVTADVENVTEDATVAAAMATVDGIDNYVAYDITATLAEGETATVSIPVPTEWAEGELTVYYITDEGTVSDETFEVSYADGYATFTVTHFSTYVVGVAGSDGTVTEVTYVLDILDENDTVIDWVTSLEQVTSSTTLDLGVLLTRDGETWTPEAVQYVSCATRTGGSFTPAKGTLYWTVNDDAIVTSIDASGLVTFSGAKDGLVNVSVYYCDPDSTKWMYDTITVTVTSKDFYTDTTDKDNFPEYPDEGSININKTATAVGNFSETGIAQIELYGNGVPVEGGGPFDVVLMFDMSNSMSNNGRVDPAKKAALAFLETVCLDSSGKWNGLEIGISICSFNNGASTKYPSTSSTDFTQHMVDITSESIYTAARTAINNLSTSSGTDYISALKQAYNILAATKEEGRPQYLIFLTDGLPTNYAYISSTQLVSGSSNHNYSTLTDSTYGTVQTINAKSTGGAKYEIDVTNLLKVPEYYSTLMKDAGVEIYSVGLDLAATSTVTLAEAQTIVSHISSAESTESTTENNSHTFFVTNDYTALTEAFIQMGEAMRQAATDVTIYDQITEEYELIFELPDAITNKMATDSTYKDPTNGQEFYVEVIDYALDSSYNRTGTYDTLIRIYIDAGGAYYYKDPDDKTTKTYYTAYNSETNPTGVSVDFNNGEVASIVCQYFTYNAATKSFTWTTDKLGKDNQIALRYFVYLTNSLEYLYDEDNSTEVPAAPYDTNTIAWIEYKNHLDNLCRKEFPVPQLTWNGAQVTYYFYLVNEKGIPINSAGEVISFTNAVQVTDSYTHSVVWNTATGEGVTELFVEYLAADILPAYYVLYDPTASYTIHVYEDETGTDLGNHFIIAGEKPINGDDDGVTTDTDYTTKVFMDKSSTKYDLPGTYTAANVFTGFDFADTTVAFAVMFAPSLQEDVVVVDFGLDVVVDVTANDKVDTIADNIILNGVSAEKYASVVMNNGVSYSSNFATEDPVAKKSLTISVENADNGTVRVKQTSMEFAEPVTFYYDAAVTFSNDTNGYMYSAITVIPATTVYYEDEFVDLTTYTRADSNSEYEETAGWASAVASTGAIVGATQASDRPGTSLISAALDADNNYGYDAAYDSCSEYSMGSAAKISVNANQYGTAEFSFYGTGFDVIALTSNTTGTLIVQVFNEDGTVAKTASVDTYYGYTYGIYEVTYTLNENGKWEQTAIGEALPADSTEKVYDSKDELTKEKRTENEDGSVTATGYIKVWKAVENDPNALYQVPVMKISGLEYGMYTAKIFALYYSSLDHTTGTDGYDLYLDAIRIYDPAGTNEEANDAYVKDGEGYPQYIELRNQVIQDSGATVEKISMGRYQVTLPEGKGTLAGAMFIDSNPVNTNVADYIKYGPNNELYLTNGQAVTFNLDLSSFVDTSGNSIVADVQVGLKLANGANATYEIYNTGDSSAKFNTMSGTVKTATDMYYSIKKQAESGTIVITNTGDGILSITNIKITFTKDPNATSTSGVVEIDGESATNAVNSLSYVTPSTPNFNPESMDITFNRTKAEVGNNVIVTVTTSSDVKDLLVNGKIATNKTTSYLTGETTWSFTVPVVDNGSLKVTVVGYDSNGEYTVPYSESVTVINQSGTAEDLLGKLFG